MNLGALDPRQAMTARAMGGGLEQRLAVLERRLDALQRRGITPKLAFPFRAGWASLNAGVATNYLCFYYKDAAGHVVLEGLATTPAGIAAGAPTIGDLPPGFRPGTAAANRTYDTGALTYNTTIGNYQINAILIQTDGQVIVHTFNGIGAGGWVSFNNIRFIPES